MPPAYHGHKILARPGSKKSAEALARRADEAGFADGAERLGGDFVVRRLGRNRSDEQVLNREPFRPKRREFCYVAATVKASDDMVLHREPVRVRCRAVIPEVQRAMASTVVCAILHIGILLAPSPFGQCYFLRP